MNKYVSIILNGKDNATQAFSRVGASSNRLQNQIASLKMAFGGLVAGVGAASLARWSIKSVSDLEQVQTSFETMLGSVEKSQKLMGQLRTFAATTPFEMEGITDATKKLLAFGFAQDDVIPQLRRLGDIGSAIGVPLSELAEIYGKARVQGRLFAEDVNQLTGRGIPVIQQFAKQFGVTDSEVRKLVESGKIGFKQLEQAIIDLTKAGSMFGGGMEKQSKTLAGKWSTMKDTIKDINNDLMVTFLPALKNGVDLTAEMVANLKVLLAGGDKKPPGSNKDMPIEDRIKEVDAAMEKFMRDNRQFFRGDRGGVNQMDPEGKAARLFGLAPIIKEFRELRQIQQDLRQEQAENLRRLRDKLKPEIQAEFEARKEADRMFLEQRGLAFGRTNKKIRDALSEALTPDSLIDGIKRAAIAIGNLQDQGGELLSEWDRKAFQFNARREERLAMKDQIQEQRREIFERGPLSAVESRFLTRGSGAIDPALVEAKKNNRIAEKNLKELQEQNRHLRKLAGKRGLQPANLN